MELHWNDEVRQAAERVRFLPLRSSSKGREKQQAQQQQEEAQQEEEEQRQCQQVLQGSLQHAALAMAPVGAAGAYTGHGSPVKEGGEGSGSRTYNGSIGGGAQANLQGSNGSISQQLQSTVTSTVTSTVLKIKYIEKKVMGSPKSKEAGKEA
jgi:hypothetical protein